MDTDVALGAARGDVDDGFALAALFRAHRAGAIRLAGVSTVFGNTTAARAEICARRIAEAAGAAVEIVRGAPRRGAPSSAAEGIAALAGGAEIVALGPLTNVAAAVEKDPALPLRVSLRLVGGNVSSRGFLAPLWPFEFNLAVDAGAARRVLAAPWREIVLYPLDVVSALRADEERLRRLAALSSLGSYLARESSRWLKRTRWRHFGRGFPVWDLPAALEAAGALSTVKTESEIRLRLRPLSGNTARLHWVKALVPNKAWAGFESLLLGNPRPGPLSAPRQEVH
ncbi:MAG: nucleoside hydrolase [Thermoanaerobaculia bacterium]